MKRIFISALLVTSIAATQVHAVEKASTFLGLHTLLMQCNKSYMETAKNIDVDYVVRKLIGQIGLVAILRPLKERDCLWFYTMATSVGGVK